MNCGNVEAVVVDALVRYASGMYNRGVVMYTDATAELHIGGSRYLAAMRGLSVATARGVKVVADYLLIRGYTPVFGCRLVIRRGAYRHKCFGKECPREVVEESLRQLGL